MPTPEPLLTGAKARAILGRLKGFKAVDHHTLVHLVKKEGLPKHEDPFGSGRWCFRESEIVRWFESRLAGGKTPMRGPGRPCKTAPVQP